MTSKAPRWVVAYKFEAEQALTKLHAHRGAGGQDRQADAGGPSGAGAAGRHHGQPGQPAQRRLRSPARTSASATWWWSRRRARSSRTSFAPSHRRTGAEKVFHFPATVPVPAVGRSSATRAAFIYRCTGPNCPGPAEGACSVSTPTATPWTSRDWASHRRAAGGRRAGAVDPGPVPPDSRAASRAGTHGQEVGPEPAGRHRGQQGTRPDCRADRPGHSPRRRNSGRAARGRVPHHRRPDDRLRRSGWLR